MVFSHGSFERDGVCNLRYHISRVGTSLDSSAWRECLSFVNSVGALHEIGRATCSESADAVGDEICIVAPSGCGWVVLP